VAMVAFAISMGALFGLAAVAIDIGRLAMVANETQNVADIAATAGAVNLLNSGTATTARADAQSVVAQNRLAGAAAAIATGDIQVGQYNAQTNTFTNGVNPPDAVKATKSTTVQNLFVGFFGSSFLNSSVTRTATAGFTGPGQARPTLPLVIGDCDFGALSQCTLDPTCLPKLTQAPATTNNTGWIKDDNPYYPPACQKNGGTPPTVSVGDDLVLQGGQKTPNLRQVDDCVNATAVDTVVNGVPGKYAEFLVPVVSCNKSNFNQDGIVVGFATIVVKVGDVDTSGGGKGVTVQAIYKEVDGAPGGGVPFGSGHMRLYN
jgi:Flp pilus assembly protein TadG